MRKQVFNVSYECKIILLECNAVTLNNTLLVPIDTVRKNFIHNYCRKCHSFQGSSLDERVTIFDSKFAHVNRKWLYTAATRTTELKNVLFYDYDEKLRGRRPCCSTSPRRWKGTSSRARKQSVR